jgi:hypothetical protein
LDIGDSKENYIKEYKIRNWLRVKMYEEWISGD